MTTVDICNMALTYCGSDDVLTTMNDATKSARLCSQNYDIARQCVLQRSPWKFAIKRAQVNLDTTETPVFGYTARFQLPEDYIRIVSVNERLIEFTCEGNYLLCNESGPINLRYVRNETAVELFDPLFIDALALDLAERIVYALTQSNERLAEIKKQAREKLAKARFTDAIEQSVIAQIANTYTDARRSIAPSRDYSPPGG